MAMPRRHEDAKTIANKGENDVYGRFWQNETLCQKRRNGTVEVPFGAVGTLFRTVGNPNRFGPVELLLAQDGIS
jgi:hypothetical protein